MSLFATVPKDAGDDWLAGRLNDAGLFKSAELPAREWYLWLAQLTSREDVVPMLRTISEHSGHAGFQGLLMCAGHERTFAWARQWADAEPFPDRFVAYSNSQSPFWTKPFWSLVRRAPLAQDQAERATVDA
jgi:hypothetical protein